MAGIGRSTTLDELRKQAKAAKRDGDGPVVSENMVRSVQQSMRVEGIRLTEAQIRAAAERVLSSS